MDSQEHRYTGDGLGMRWIFITTLVTRNDTAKVWTLKSIATPETVPARWSQRHISDTASGRRVSRFPPAASNRPNTVSRSQKKFKPFLTGLSVKISDKSRSPSLIMKTLKTWFEKK